MCTQKFIKMFNDSPVALYLVTYGIILKLNKIECSSSLNFTWRFKNIEWFTRICGGMMEDCTGLETVLVNMRMHKNVI